MVPANQPAKFAKEGLTFDDVLLLPAASRRAAERGVAPRRGSRRGIGLTIPIVSAAMDTVTEAPLAIAMARAGRHRRHPPQPVDRGPGRRGRQGEALRVRDDRRPRHARPRRTSCARRPRPHGPLQDLRRADHRRRRPAGRHPHQPRPALRRRPRPTRIGDGHDQRAASSPPRSAPPSRRPRTSSGSTASRSCRSSTTTASSRGLITVKDIQKQIEYPNATKDDQGRLRVAAAVGAGPDALERAAGARRGRRRRARGRHRPRPLRRRARHRPQDRRAQLRRRRSSPATSPPPTAPRRCIDAGADAVKVGVGPGLDLHHPGRRRRRRAADHRHLRLRRGRRAPRASTIIADGGIQYSGDIAKALAAGRRRRDARQPARRRRREPRARSCSTRASASRSTGAWARWAP